MTFSTTIKKIYWEEKLKDEVKNGFFYEYKSTTLYWNIRISKLLNNCPVKGVFLVGNKPYRRCVVNISIVETASIPKKYKSVITTKHCYKLKCVPNRRKK